jgi:8-oxo-dGTP pyrophosphatase MutT (NUDIX family)
MTEEQSRQMEKAPFPIVFSCVDGIVHNDSHICFIKKPEKDDLLRLPGGMIDVNDFTIIDALKREMYEEINLRESWIDSISPVVNMLMFDKGRYDSGTSKHRLRTNVYDIKVDDSLYMSDLEPGDDAGEVIIIAIKQLYDVAWLSRNVLAGHIPLIAYWLGTKQFNI